MPAWVAPLAAALLAVLLLNLVWLVQRSRRRTDDWSRRFLHELRRWDGRVPEELERHEQR